MPTATFEYSSEAERGAIEQAIAFVAEMHALAQAAPSGQILDLCEGQALDRGRRLLQTTLQQAVQSRVETLEQQKGRVGNARARAGSAAVGGAAGRR